MDKKKKIVMKRILIIFSFFAAVFNLNAQDVREIQFCDNKYEYGVGKDSITLFFKILDSDSCRSTKVMVADLEKNLVIYEDNVIVAPNRRTIRYLSSGQRIPADYTFSVLVDLSIPEEGKLQIYDGIGSLVNSAPDSCVYLSFFGNDVTSTQLITKLNYQETKSQFLKQAEKKYLWDALYLKLAEFSDSKAELKSNANMQTGYTEDKAIANRAKESQHNILLVFIEGSQRPDEDAIGIGSAEVSDYQTDASHIAPKTYAFYYKGNGFDENVETSLKFITRPLKDGKILEDRAGIYKSSDDLSEVMKDFEQIVQDAMYDYAFVYKATEGKAYSGKTTTFVAEWEGEQIGTGAYSIGTAENPWPTHKESTTDSVTKYMSALWVTLLTIISFFFVMKILIPYSKSKLFELKYYKKYVPEENVKRRICSRCRQDIQPGEPVVMKCKHIMHVKCWQENGYKCSEYGQNCKEGIQDHVELEKLFSNSSLKDFQQTVAGICAGLVSWIIYELMGRGGFSSIATGIVKVFFSNENQQMNLFDTCVTKVSAFLTIGLLLGLSLSLVFRYFDEYRKKDRDVYLKIFGLSLLSGIIGIASFAIGAIILCLLLPIVNKDPTYIHIPWYCSLPAYLLFSVCTSLSLTIKSTIPVKSALIGGVCSAVIGFLVLYFANFTSSQYVNILLDFVIYGGGLEASLVTVRMLAEEYFLVIQSEIRKGQKIPIHKWMNATGGGNKVSIGMNRDCEIQMNWEKSNNVAKEHAQLYIDPEKKLPFIKPLEDGIEFNSRAKLDKGKPVVLSNGDTFKIGETIFQYQEKTNNPK